MGGQEKRGVFLILACIYKYIEVFEEQDLSKVLFSNAPNALNRNSNISCLLGDLETHALPIEKGTGLANVLIANLGLRNSPI